MKDIRTPPIRDAGEQAVSEAWRALPQPEPDAALDARVRAGVAAVLEAERSGAASAVARPTQAWQRAAAPLAIAATLVIAFGVGLFWERDGRRQESTAPADRVAQAPVAAAPSAGLSEAPPPAVPAPLPMAKQERTENRPVPEAPRAVAADAAKSRRGEPVPRQAEPPVDELARPSAAEAPAAKMAPAPDSPLRARREAAPPAAAPVAVPPAGMTADETDAGPSLDTVRDLLRASRRGAAKLVFERWREAHPQAPVPEDLRAFAEEIEATRVAPAD